MSASIPASANENLPAPAPGRMRAFLAEFVESRLAAAGLLVVLVMSMLAILAPVVMPQDPYDLAQLSIFDNLLPPGSVGSNGMRHWLGTDEQGRDILSAIVFGLRLSLAVGLASTLIALAIGLLVGIAAAYFGGRIDAVIMRVVDIQLAFPAILIALILLALLGKGVDKVIIALVSVQWAYYARTVRAAALAERSKEYIEAAECLALPPLMVMRTHLLPNCLPPLVVVATMQVAAAIALEATLSFLGVGVPITEPSLGLLISNGYNFMLSGTYWISFFPGLALLAAIFAINLVGDRLRDILNPKLRR
jgi:peptide/nickel transport system permease protein